MQRKGHDTSVLKPRFGGNGNLVGG
jgi:hypothetical protein